jgi:hypothetical protein
MTLTATIGRKFRKMRADAHRKWIAMAESMAAGEGEPDAMSVIECARLLGIDDPGAAIEHDADVLRELAAAERATESCNVKLAEKLAPWDGDVQKLRDAIHAAEREVERLKALHLNCAVPPSTHWRWRSQQLRRENPRLFAKPSTVRKDD